MTENTIIVNPTAGRGQTASRWPAIRDLLQSAGFPFHALETYGVGHATLLAQEAIQRGSHLIIVVGGDGTWNEAVNGSIGRNRQSTPGVELALIPTGSTNNFSRSAGIPRGIHAAVQQALSPASRSIDLGLAEYWPLERARGVHYTTELQARTRYFVNAAVLGFAAEMAERAGRLNQKAFTPFISFSSTLNTVWNHSSKNVHLRIDNWRRQDLYSGIFITNGRYTGKASAITPDADLIDGRFDVLLAGDIGKFELVTLLASISRGTHLDNPKLSLRRAQSISVETTDRTVIELDGEVVGLAPASFTILPQALRVRI